jgi:hypothetical protein
MIAITPQQIVVSGFFPMGFITVLLGALGQMNSP